MDKAIRIFAVVFLAMIILSCTDDSVLKGEPASADSQDQDQDIAQILTCDDVTCSNGLHCEEGSCLCDSGTKKCGDQCISDDACCGDSDCESGFECKDTVCEKKFSCVDHECLSNQICSEKSKGCACPSGYKWCEGQLKCIPSDHCCSKYDCRSNERCVDTITSAELCVESGAKACKIFDTTGSKTLELPDSSFDLNVTKVNYEKDVVVFVDGQQFIVAPGTPVKISEKTNLFINKLRETGGQCRDFDRDA